MQRKPLSGLVSLRIDRRASQTIGGGGKSRGDDRPIRNRAPFYSVAFAFGSANMISYAL